MSSLTSNIQGSDLSELTRLIRCWWTLQEHALEGSRMKSAAFGKVAIRLGAEKLTPEEQREFDEIRGRGVMAE